MTDIEVVRERICKHHTREYEWEALTALDSLEAELAQAHATLNAIELLLGKRDDETGWDAIKRLQTELAQAREERDAAIAQAKMAWAKYDEALGNPMRYQVENARYREALERIAIPYMDDPPGGGQRASIARAALTGETPRKWSHEGEVLPP